jgi:hypothetical protein
MSPLCSTATACYALAVSSDGNVSKRGMLCVTGLLELHHVTIM